MMPDRPGPGARPPRAAPSFAPTVGLAGVLAVILVAVPGTAHAYIDPGTGSFVIQGIIAALVGAGVALKLFWRRLTGRGAGKRPPADEDDDA